MRGRGQRLRSVYLHRLRSSSCTKNFNPVVPKAIQSLANKSVTRIQDTHKRFLRDLDHADVLHAFLALFLFLEDLHFTRDIAAVELGCDVPCGRRGYFRGR